MAQNLIFRSIKSQNDPGELLVRENKILKLLQIVEGKGRAICCLLVMNFMRMHFQYHSNAINSQKSHFSVKLGIETAPVSHQ